MFNQGILVMDKFPICKTVPRPNRRDSRSINTIPSHDPYIPRTKPLFYNCSDVICYPAKLESIVNVTSPKLVLKSCFQQKAEDLECESIRYNYLKNVDKLLFLSSNIHKKKFYLVNCLVYSDGGRVCHKKDTTESLTELVDTGTMARPREPSVLSQDDFICEEGQNREVNCDLDPYSPFDSGLRLKEKLKLKGDILLKTGPYVVILKKNCINSWCGYSGHIFGTRRYDSYDPPGDWIYKCYYARKQQVCKRWYKKRQESFMKASYLQ